MSGPAASWLVLARVAQVSGAAAWVVFVALGVLLPLTAGVSVVLAPLSVLGWAVAFLLARAALPRLPVGSPAYARAERARSTGRRGLGLVVMALALVAFSAVGGVLVHLVGTFQN